jgi:prevent-host-death family protein
MKVVGAFEAKNKLGQLLDLAEQGEEVTITRHGKAVARIVPAIPTTGRRDAQAAIRRIRERAEALKLGRFDWAEWKTYRDDGRP